MPTLEKIMEKPIIKRFKLVTQNADLSREVTGVGVLDYEFDDLHSSSLFISEGEFIITSLVTARSDEDMFYNILEKLIEIGISGLAVKNVYFKEIPEKCIKLANDNNVPLFIFDDTIFYEDIIYVIMQELNKENPNDIIIDKILWEYYSNEESFDLLKIEEKEYNIIIIKNESKENTLSIQDLKDKYIYYNYYDKVIIFLPTNHSIKEYIDDLQLRLTKKYYIGYASLTNDLRYSLQTALNSLKVAQYKDVHYIANFENSYLSLLIQYYENPNFIKFSKEFISKVKDDEEMYDTLLVFVKNNRDFKSSALELNVHINTVRFRVEKAEKLFDLSFEREFFTSLSLAFEIDQMNKLL